MSKEKLLKKYAKEQSKLNKALIGTSDFTKRNLDKLFKDIEELSKQINGASL